MVGGERSTQDDSKKGSARTLVSKLRLRALLQAAGRTSLSLTTSSPLLTDTLTQTFFSHQLFPCSQTADHTLSKFECIFRARLRRGGYFCYPRSAINSVAAYRCTGGGIDCIQHTRRSPCNWVNPKPICHRTYPRPYDPFHLPRLVRFC
jgi:hypothetical protein